MGPLLLSRLMGLNETQEGVLQIAFRMPTTTPAAGRPQGPAVGADILRRAGRGAFGQYGNVSKATVGTIQRQLLASKPKARTSSSASRRSRSTTSSGPTSGRGTINILAADKLMQNPKLYATFLLWLLSELFEALPEVGDPEKPNLVFFFDEAHLLFDDAPKPCSTKSSKSFA